jgi:hypothetical protein
MATLRPDVLVLDRFPPAAVHLTEMPYAWREQFVTIGPMANCYPFHVHAQGDDPMKSFRTGCAAALLAAGAAQAQLVDPMPATLQARPSPEAVAFAKIPLPLEPAYMLDEGAHPFTKLFTGFSADPRLLAGINLNRYLALEAGYAERQDRGFHLIAARFAPHSAYDTTGALGLLGFHSYAGVKATAPITGDLSAYGKLGLAHSERRGVDAVGKKQNVDTGLYSGLGARYKLNDKASVNVEGQKFGHSAEKWGKYSNGNSVNAKMSLGF